MPYIRIERFAAGDRQKTRPGSRSPASRAVSGIRCHGADRPRRTAGWRRMPLTPSGQRRTRQASPDRAPSRAEVPRFWTANKPRDDYRDRITYGFSIAGDVGTLDRASTEIAGVMIPSLQISAAPNRPSPSAGARPCRARRPVTSARGCRLRRDCRRMTNRQYLTEIVMTSAQKISDRTPSQPSGEIPPRRCR